MTNASVDHHITEVRIKYYLGLCFYDKQSPESYRIQRQGNPNTDSEPERILVPEWIKGFNADAADHMKEMSWKNGVSAHVTDTWAHGEGKEAHVTDTWGLCQGYRSPFYRSSQGPTVRTGKPLLQISGVHAKGTEANVTNTWGLCQGYRSQCYRYQDPMVRV